MNTEHRLPLRLLNRAPLLEQAVHVALCDWSMTSSTKAKEEDNKDSIEKLELLCYVDFLIFLHSLNCQAFCVQQLKTVF